MQIVLQVNYWAVLVCVVLAMGISSLWYSPILLGHAWMEAIDKSEDELHRDFNAVKTYSLSFIGHLFIVYSLAQLMAHSNAVSLADGIRLSFLCWMGFIVAPMAINSLFARRSIKLLLVDSGYHLIVLLISGIILSTWTV